MSPPESSPEQPLSEILRTLAAGEGPIVMADLVAAFGSRAFGAILLVFAVACALPLPPGSSTILGAPLVLLAPQVALGVQTPWLPRALRHRTISRLHLRHVAARLVPTLERIEKVSRPRLLFLVGPLGERLIGLTCTLLALVLILPIPLGNVLPAAAVSLLSLALITRDGLLALAGYVATAASAGVLVLAIGIVMRTLRHILTILAGGA